MNACASCRRFYNRWHSATSGRLLSRLTFLALLCALGAGGCTSSRPEDYRPLAIRERILAGLPAGWREAEPSQMQRDFIVSYFPDPRTKALLLEGPKLDPLFWTDKDGRHSEPLYRECLHLWIVPADVRPDFLTLNPKVGPQPRCFYLSAAGKVYGLDSMGWISNPARLQEIESSEGLKEIGSEGGGELSWRGWRRDIRASIGEMR